MNNTYDKIYPIKIATDRFLAFDVFHRCNELIIIRPIYNREKLDDINIFHKNIKLTLKAIHKRTHYEGICILIYDFVEAFDEMHTICIKWQNNITYYLELYHFTPTTSMTPMTKIDNIKLGQTTLLKNDYVHFPLFYSYYSAQGVEWFWIYYNGKLTEEIKQVICTVGQQNVTLIEWDFRYWNNNNCFIKHHAQIGQLHHALYKYGKTYCEFMIFNDIDEYMVNPNGLLIDLVNCNNTNSPIVFYNHWAEFDNQEGLPPTSLPIVCKVNKDNTNTPPANHGLQPRLCRNYI